MNTVFAHIPEGWSACGKFNITSKAPSGARGNIHQYPEGSATESLKFCWQVHLGDYWVTGGTVGFDEAVRKANAFLQAPEHELKEVHIQRQKDRIASLYGDIADAEKGLLALGVDIDDAFSHGVKVGYERGCKDEKKARTALDFLSEAA